MTARLIGTDQISIKSDIIPPRYYFYPRTFHHAYLGYQSYAKNNPSPSFKSERYLKS
jgi:hypothetical protein